MTRSINKLRGRTAAAEVKVLPAWRPLVVALFEPPRPGSMRAAELPSVAGGVRYYPRRPWAAQGQ